MQYLLPSLLVGLFAAAEAHPGIQARYANNTFIYSNTSSAIHATTLPINTAGFNNPGTFTTANVESAFRASGVSQASSQTAAAPFAIALALSQAASDQLLTTTYTTVTVATTTTTLGVDPSASPISTATVRIDSPTAPVCGLQTPASTVYLVADADGSYHTAAAPSSTLVASAATSGASGTLANPIGASGSFGTPANSAAASPQTYAGTSSAGAQSTTTNITTLLPSEHWDMDGSDLVHLSPSVNASFYYSTNGVSDPSQSHQFAFLQANFSYSVVVLDNSAHIQNVSCPIADTIVASFATFQSYNSAKSSWSASTNFSVITYAAGCSNTTDQRALWVVESITFNDSEYTVRISASELAFEQGISNAQISWGTYQPAGNSSSSSTGRSTSAGVGTSSLSPSSSSAASESSATGTSSGSASQPTSSSSSSCGAAPNATLHGLVTAACGDPNFDADIDNVTGYIDLSYTSDNSTEDAEFLDDPLYKRHVLSKRWCGPSCWAEKLAEEVRAAAAAVNRAVIQPAIQATKEAVATTVNFVVAVARAATSYDPSTSKDFPISVAPTDNAVSPWGSAYTIYQADKASGAVTADLTMYCVNCGIHGNVHLAGSAHFDVVTGLSKAVVSMNGNLNAGLSLGLEAHVAYNKTFTKTIVSVGLPGLSVPNIVTIGPIAELKAQATLNFDASGAILVGATMTIPAFDAELDLVGSGSHATGFTPTITPIFNATGQINAKASLGLPISVGVGIAIPLIKFDKQIALIDTPSIGAELKFQGGTGPAPTDATCYNGLEYTVIAENDVSLDLFGLSRLDLADYKSPALAHSCIKFVANKNPTSTSSDVSSFSQASSTTAASVTSSTVLPTTTPVDSTTTSSSDQTATSSLASSTMTDSTASASETSATTAPSTTASDNVQGSATSTTSMSTSELSSTSSPALTATSITSDATPQPTVATPTSSDNQLSTQSTPSTSVADSTVPSSTVSQDAPTDTPALKMRRQTSAAATNTTSDASEEVATVADLDTFVDDSPTSEPADNSDFSSLASEAEAQESNSTADASSDGSYITILDSTGRYQLGVDDLGNFYLGTANTTDGGALFITEDSVVISDDGGRYLLYYPEELAAYNVSRFRVAEESHIPRTAEIVSLAAFDVDSSNSTAPAYIAYTGSGKPLYTMVCNFVGSEVSQLFLATDPVAGASILLQEELRYTVTGNVVSQCVFMAFVAPLGSTSNE